MSFQDIIVLSNIALPFATSGGAIIFAFICLAVSGIKSFGLGLANGASLITLIIFGVDLGIDVVNVRIDHDFGLGEHQIGQLLGIFIEANYRQLGLALLHAVVVMIFSAIVRRNSPRISEAVSGAIS